MIGRLRTGILCALAIFLHPGSSLQAQQVRVIGVVYADATGAPLEGVYASLLRPGAERPVAAVLSNEQGRFLLSAQSQGTYRIRLERVGLATATTPDFFLSTDGREMEFVMVEQPVALTGLVVESPVRVCGLDESEALLVQRWWEEARKALRAANLVLSRDMGRYRVERFQREWSADLRSVRAERTVPPDSTAQALFRSAAPEAVSEKGFVWGDRGDRRFLGPDPRVLLSEDFLAGHCFRPDVDGETPGVLSLRVQPSEDRTVTDIDGTLRLDTISGRLRSFDFKYLGLPDDLRMAREAGGHLEFTYLRSGAWIVSEWWIRMPWIDSRVWPRRVLAYVDDGGRVVGIPPQRAENLETDPGSVAAPAAEGTSGTALGGALPKVFELSPLSVSVTNGRLLRLLTQSLGVNPTSLFGFRVIQGSSLEEAKRLGELDPTETLRWLFIPVVHGGPCVFINTSGWTRDSATPGGSGDPLEPSCGSLYLDEQLIGNELIDSIDMTEVAVITTLPGEVRLFTKAFFENR